MLADWTRRRGWVAALVWLGLALLVAAVAAAFWYGTPLWEMTRGVDQPGLRTLPIEAG